MMSSAKPSLEDELGIPSDATLSPTSVRVSLETSNGASSIPVSAKSCTRPVDEARSLVVGRQAATADIRIQHGSISRKHSVLYILDNKLYVKDLGGKHGTHINGQRVAKGQDVQLSDRDAIQFGNVKETIFRVKIEEIHETDRVGQDPEQNNPTAMANDRNSIEKAGEGLSGRAKRQAEIAAMMESLDQTPVYNKSNSTSDKPTAEEDHLENGSQQQQTQEEAMELRALATRHKLPVAKRLALAAEGNRKNVVSCLAIDPAGSRFVTGSTDTHLRYFDFGGMLRDRTGSFKDVIPDDGYLVVQCAYSNTGDRILVGTSSVQPRVLDREGQEIIKFVRGDMYVTDQAKTVGHTSTITSVDWHPLDRQVVLTSSDDGSARLWNLQGKTQFQMLVCDKVFQAKSARGQRTAVKCVCFHPGGREFALGTACGSIQIWNRTRVSSRPERAVFQAHEAENGRGATNKPITSLIYSVDGTKLASRSSKDDMVHVWEAKRLSKSSRPWTTCAGLESEYEMSNACFSPDGETLCAGSSIVHQNGNESREENGILKFYDLTGRDADRGNDGAKVIDPILSLPWATNSAPIITRWHPKLNQIFVGCSDGGTVIFYDPALSSKGALLPGSRGNRGVDVVAELLKSKVSSGSSVITGTILTPFSQPRQKGKKRKGTEANDSREPERPTTGKHKTGTQAGGSVNFAQFVADQTVAKSKAIAGNDPREALFQYKREGEALVDAAYEGNVRKLAAKTAEQEEEEMKQKKR